MDWRKILVNYYEKFGENIGIPWNGFQDEETGIEYWKTLQYCIDAGIPITDEQRSKYFPKFEPELVY